MPEPDSRRVSSGASSGEGLKAWAKERIEGHEWRVELREHRLADWKRRKGMTTIAIYIRLDGELLASVYPLQAGFGVDIVSEHLDFDDPVRVKGGLAPAVGFYKKGHNPFKNMMQGGEPNGGKAS